MSSAQLDLVLKHIRRVTGMPSAGPCSDRRLVEDFLRSRDETAFTELVRRHGPMVLNVCRSVLHHEQDAEDAFQATFLVLAQKADSIRQRETLAGWLWGVANHLAKKAQVAAARQRRLPPHLSSGGREDGDKEDALDPLLDMTVRELRQMLYHELQRLPEKYRVPLVLCYLEGRTQEEAASQLGWSKGTVRGRLNRGREKLRGRLARRGLTLSAGLLTTALTVNPASASVPTLLIDSTAKAALAFAGGQAASSGLVTAAVVSLAAETIKALSVTKLKIVTAVLVAVGAASLTVGAIAKQTVGWAESSRPTGPDLVMVGLEDSAHPTAMHPRLARANQPSPPSPPPEKAKADEQKPVTITGRVLGPDGKPVARASVAILARARRQYRSADFDAEHGELLGQTNADADGKFRLTSARTSSARFWEVYALVAAKGHGLGWQRLSPDAKAPEVVLKLPAEQVVRGRLLDVQGQPAARVTVSFALVGKLVNGEWQGAFLDGLPKRPPWPQPVATDDKGRFEIRGFNRDRGG